MEKNDMKCFEQLYSEYKDLMYTQAKQYTASEEAAEKVILETLKKLVKRHELMSQLSEAQKAAYIVYYIRFTALRRYNFIPVEKQDDTAYNSDQSPVPSEEQRQSLFRPEDLFPQWSKLPARYRDLLAFRYFLDLSLWDLARAYRCSFGEVKRRIRISREAAKALAMNREGENDDERSVPESEIPGRV